MFHLSGKPGRPLVAEGRPCVAMEDRRAKSPLEALLSALLGASLGSAVMDCLRYIGTGQHGTARRRNM